MEDLIQKARERYSELTKIMEAAQAAGPEYQELGIFLKMANAVEKRFTPETHPGAAVDESTGAKPSALASRVQKISPFPRPPLQRDGVNMTSNLADWVLQVHGPRLHLNMILDRMIEEGWKGSGDRRKDWKNLFNNLNGKKKRFRNVGKNVWERVEGG